MIIKHAWLLLRVDSKLSWIHLKDFSVAGVLSKKGISIMCMSTQRKRWYQVQDFFMNLTVESRFIFKGHKYLKISDIQALCVTDDRRITFNPRALVTLEV